MITPKQLLALTAKWLAISIIVIVCTLYLVDDASFHFRARHSNSAVFGTVDMENVLAIELKGGKVEYTLDRTHPPQVLTCVNSLFPHAGFTPCWYLKRQARQAKPMLVFHPAFLSGWDVWNRRSQPLLTLRNALRYSALRF